MNSEWYLVNRLLRFAHNDNRNVAEVVKISRKTIEIVEKEDNLGYNVLVSSKASFTEEWIVNSARQSKRKGEFK